MTQAGAAGGGEKVNVAVCGAGYWGKNVIRAFNDVAAAQLRYVCDLDESLLAALKIRYPNIRMTTAYDEVLGDDEVRAVAVVTPPGSHFEVARRALDAGKDVFVEKPMTLSVEDAKALVAFAEARGRILMVGHLLEYHPGLWKLKQLIDDGELGEILYICCRRVNLGQVKRGENALWSLAPHDISTVLYLLGEEPLTISARGESYLQQGIHDIVFVTLQFSSRRLVQIHVSWLDPRKAREMMVVGSKKMAVFEDTRPTEKLVVYDSGITGVRENFESYQDFLTLRFGDITIPRLDGREPLVLETRHFVECVRTRQRPRTDGRNGLRVVRVLAAAQASLDRGGGSVRVNGEVGP
jgi:predicted dehydrogenase